MDKDEKKEECCKEKHFFKKHRWHHHGGSSALYGLGVIGALFYFLQGVNTFTAVFIGIVKAIFWPALVVFKVLTLLQL